MQNEDETVPVKKPWATEKQKTAEETAAEEEAKMKELDRILKEELRIHEQEQRQEMSTNQQLLRKLAREKHSVCWRYRKEDLLQKRMMKVLVKEAHEQKSDILVALSDSFRHEDTRHLQELGEKIHDLDSALEETKEIKQRISDLKFKEKRVDSEISETRQRIRTVISEELQQVEKKRLLAERQQEGLHWSLGKQLTENRELRDLMSHLNRHRDCVVSVLQGLKTDCQRLTHQLGLLAEGVQETSFRLNSSKRRMTAAKDNLDKLTSTFDTDMAEWNYRIARDKNTIQFISVTSKTRFDERAEKRQQQSRLAITEKKLKLENCQRTLRSACQELQVDDAQGIITVFQETKARNHYLFAGILERSQACFKLKAEIQKVKDKILHIRESRRKSEQEIQDRIAALQKEAEMYSRLAEQKEAEVETAEEVVAVYCNSLQQTLNRLGIPPPDAPRLTIPSKRLEAHIALMLRVLEGFVNRLYHMKTLKDLQDYKEEVRQSILPIDVRPLPRRSAVVKIIPVEPPALEGERSQNSLLHTRASHQDSVNVLSFSEIKQEVNARLDAAHSQNKDLLSPSLYLSSPSRSHSDVTAFTESTATEDSDDDSTTTLCAHSLVSTSPTLTSGGSFLSTLADNRSSSSTD